MSYSNYAKLGESCETNMNEIIDNKKFFPIDEPEYKTFYTKMHSYPSSQEKISEDTPNGREEILPQKESYKRCCGNR